MKTNSRKQQILDMLAGDPNDTFLRYGLAMEYVSEADDSGAVRCFQELLAIDPNYVPAYLQIGQAHVRQGNPSEAALMLRTGIGVARRQNDMHAAEEMQSLLATLV